MYNVYCTYWLFLEFFFCRVFVVLCDILREVLPMAFLKIASKDPQMWQHFVFPQSGTYTTTKPGSIFSNFFLFHLPFFHPVYASYPCAFEFLFFIDFDFPLFLFLSHP